MVLDSGASKPWNNGDELLKKFISDSPDGKIDRCGDRSRHGGPRLSMEA